MGTPEVINVPSVRVNRPTAILRSSDAHNRQVEQHFVEVIAASLALANLFDAEDHADSASDEEPPEVPDERAHSDHDPGGQRQGHTQAGKQVGKNGHHPLEQCPHDQPGDGDHGNRINQCRFDSGASGEPLFPRSGQPLQDDVQNTAGFAGLNHVGGEIVENLGIAAHGIGQGCPAFHRGPDAVEDLPE